MDGGQILMFLVIGLAVGASIVMLMTGSDTALKLALLAALWAAVIGLVLVGRYRRQIDDSREQLDQEKRMHETELREVQATAEAKAAKARTEYQLRDEDMAILADIRSGLDELKAQLEELSGHSFEYEPAALRAEAWRLRELEQEASAVAGEHFPKAGDAPGAPSADAVAGRLGSTDVHGDYPRNISPELARLLDDPDTASAATSTTTPSEDGWAVSGEDFGRGAYRGTHRGAETSDTDSWTTSDSWSSADLGSSSESGRSSDYSDTSDSWSSYSSEPTPEAEPRRRHRSEDSSFSFDSYDTAVMGVHDINRGLHSVPEPEPEPEPTRRSRHGAPEPEGRRGRRRADENSSSLSVQDLLDNARRRSR